jgi:hypothetical protein
MTPAPWWAWTPLIEADLNDKSRSSERFLFIEGLML